MIDDPARYAEHWLADLAISRLPGLTLRPAAVGWATVELDRAAAELSPVLGGPTFVPAPEDRLLDATCRFVAPGSGGVAWVILEPAGEGPLAAALARHGEGLAVGWFVAVSWPIDLRLSRPAPGALGTGRRVLDGPRAGPHLVLLEQD